MGTQAKTPWKSITLKEAAALIGATVHGDDSKTITCIRPLSSAKEGDLTFFAPTSRKKHAELFRQATTSSATAIIITAYNDKISTTQLVVANPHQAVAKLVAALYQQPPITPGIHPQAVVAPSATIGKDVSIGALAVIGENVIIEDNVVIHPSVVVYPGVSIGKNSTIHAGAIIREYVVLGAHCIIQNGAIIGSDGFGYVPDKEIAHRLVPQVGNVVLGNRVDIGANTALDRATFGETRIADNTKIDNLVQIGHNVQIGEASLVCGQVGISGSTVIGKQVILAGQVGIADHVTIGDRVRAAAKTGIDNDIESDHDVAGYPQQDAKNWLRSMAVIKRLPELLRRGRIPELSSSVTTVTPDAEK